MKLRAWLIHGLLVLAGAAGGFLFAELSVRWMYGRRIVLYPRYHTDAYYNDFHIRRLRPNSTFWHRCAGGSWKFVTNAQGFRDTRPYLYPKPPSTLRTICLGDSHTEGFEVRQDRTYSEILESRLRREGRDAEVMNAGISGFGTAEQLVFLENEGIKYAPDFVVLAFSANDLDDNVKCGLFRVQDGELVVNSKEHVPGVKILNTINRFGPVRWLSENSYFYSFFFNQVWTFYKRSLSKDRSVEAVTEYAGRPPDPDEALFRYQCELTRLLVRRMHEFCHEHGVRLIILELPAGQHGRKFVPSIPEALLAAFRESSDALLLAEDVLRDFPGTDGVFVPYGQMHISEATHLVLGAAVAKKIEALDARAVQ